MHSSSSYPVHWRIGGRIWQFVAALASVLFVNPFGLIVAVIGAWLLAFAVGSAIRLVAEGPGWDVWGYATYVVAVALVTALATGHVLLTAVSGWRGAGLTRG